MTKAHGSKDLNCGYELAAAIEPDGWDVVIHQWRDGISRQGSWNSKIASVTTQAGWRGLHLDVGRTALLDRLC